MFESRVSTVSAEQTDEILKVPQPPCIVGTFRKGSLVHAGKRIYRRKPIPSRRDAR